MQRWRRWSWTARSRLGWRRSPTYSRPCSRSRPGTGAAFAVSRGGVSIVDLWGGVADPARGLRWQADTLAPVFSQTKAWVAVCLLRLVDLGRLALDAPVAAYWPEFGQAGKQDVLVSELVSHCGRLPALAEPATLADLRDPGRMAERLARQPLERDPRARFLYHGLTYGWLCGELVRRIDGRDVGRFLREEICAPFGLELWIGLPPELHERVARCAMPTTGLRASAPSAASADDLLRRYWANPVIYPPGEVVWNDRLLREAQIPAINGIAAPRSVARLFDLLANEGGALLSPAALACGTSELAAGRDPFTDVPDRFGVGFQLQCETRLFGPVGRAFGHTGIGGSVHGAWLDQGLGFSFTPTELRTAGDRRAATLTAALAEALGGH